ncbi:hypothetical protein GGE67_004708 [Rhizobium leucaenae]|nr:hypothetical protein [Rhizobium leucaenae]
MIIAGSASRGGEELLLQVVEQAFAKNAREVRLHGHRQQQELRNVTRLPLIPAAFFGIVLGLCGSAMSRTLGMCLLLPALTFVICRQQADGSPETCYIYVKPGGSSRWVTEEHSSQLRLR